MTDAFHIDGEDHQPAPHEYRGCGLDGIILLNGFERETTAYGEGVSIRNIEELHTIIGLHLVKHRKHLAPKEMRFLRREMGLTQAKLGALMDVSPQSVARYEKGDSEPGPADRLLRFLFVCSLAPPDDSTDVLRELADASMSEIDAPNEVGAAFVLDEADRWLIETRL